MDDYCGDTKIRHGHLFKNKKIRHGFMFSYFDKIKKRSILFNWLQCRLENCMIVLFFSQIYINNNNNNGN
jgi:hypothetical protein